MTITPFTPDVPGRSCWRTQGGCLPLKPGARTGYFRLNVAPEKPVGSAFLSGDTSDSAKCVNLGVKVIQDRLNMATGSTLTVDGWFGAKTDKAVREFQLAMVLTSDGIVGPTTARELLRRIVDVAAATNAVPTLLLRGLLYWESGMDPAGVGDNGWDHGIAQINLDPIRGHGTSISWDQAMDPTWATAFTARDLRRTYDAWAGKTTADPWDIAVANHNSPLLAKQWAQSGTPPVIEGRVIQIADYVAAVKRSAW